MADDPPDFLLTGAQRYRTVAEFKALDGRLLSRMSAKELAAWHAEQPADSAQRILADYEWQRRLNRLIVWGAVLASLIGACAGGLFGLGGVLLGNRFASGRWWPISATQQRDGNHRPNAPAAHEAEQKGQGDHPFPAPPAVETPVNEPLPRDQPDAAHAKQGDAQQPKD